MKGIFITFEGIEGSGKTTLITLVAAPLMEKGHTVVLTREPGGSDLGRGVRKLLLDPDVTSITPMAELLLFAADRAQHLNEVIKPGLETGKIILCDRFSDATTAYQGYGRHIPLNVVLDIDARARDGILPHLTVLLDLPVENGLERARKRNLNEANTDESRIDDEDLAFHERVRNGYLELAHRHPARFLVLNALKKPEVTASIVLDEIRERFPNVI